MCPWFVHISEFRCHRRQTGKTNEFVKSTGRIIWSWMWFNFNRVCGTIGVYISAFRILSEMDVFSSELFLLVEIDLNFNAFIGLVFLCYDFVLLCPLADICLWYFKIRKGGCYGGTMYDNGNSYGISYIRTQYLDG